MALAWPVSLSEFFGALEISKVAFWLNDAKTLSVTGGGSVIPHQRGARLWRGTVTVSPSNVADAAAYEARISLLEQVGASFLVNDRRVPWPRLDPKGALLAGATPTIATLSSNSRELGLAGLPAGYQLSRGDMIGFTYGATPTRYALHRVVTAAAADGAGETGLFEVIPYIRPGASIGASVSLIAPVCKAVLTEADYGGGRSTISEGMSFNWMQTLR